MDEKENDELNKGAQRWEYADAKISDIVGPALQEAFKHEIYHYQRYADQMGKSTEITMDAFNKALNSAYETVNKKYRVGVEVERIIPRETVIEWNKEMYEPIAKREEYIDGKIAEIVQPEFKDALDKEIYHYQRYADQMGTSTEVTGEVFNKAVEDALAVIGGRFKMTTERVREVVSDLININEAKHVKPAAPDTIAPEKTVENEIIND